MTQLEYRIEMLESRIRELERGQTEIPVRHAQLTQPQFTSALATLTEDLVSGQTAKAIITGTDQEITVSSLWIETGKRVVIGEQIGVRKYDNTGEWYFVDGRCEQVTVEPLT